MNSRQLLVESRVDGIEDTLRSLKVKRMFVCSSRNSVFLFVGNKSVIFCRSTLDPASNEFGSLLAMIALLTVQSSVQTFIHNAILSTDTSNNA